MAETLSIFVRRLFYSRSKALYASYPSRCFLSARRVQSLSRILKPFYHLREKIQFTSNCSYNSSDDIIIADKMMVMYQPTKENAAGWRSSEALHQKTSTSTPQQLDWVMDGGSACRVKLGRFWSSLGHLNMPPRAAALSASVRAAMTHGLKELVKIGSM